MLQSASMIAATFSGVSPAQLQHMMRLGRLCRCGHTGRSISVERNTTIERERVRGGVDNTIIERERVTGRGRQQVELSIWQLTQVLSDPAAAWWGYSASELPSTAPCCCCPHGTLFAAPQKLSSHVLDHPAAETDPQSPSRSALYPLPARLALQPHG